MTITVYSKVEKYLSDLTLLKTIFDAGYPEMVEPLKVYMRPLDISLTQDVDRVAFNLTVEEFALLGVYMGSDLR